MADRSRKKELRDEAKVEYKERIKHVKEVDRNDDPLKIQEIIAENLDRGDELYSRVKRKLDGTACDARHMRELVNLCQESSRRINVSSRQFDLKKVGRNLKREFEEDEGKQLTAQEFTKLVCDRYIKTFYCRPPTFEYFYGALRREDLEIKTKKRRAPRERIKVDTQATTAKEKNMEVEVEQDSTPKEVEHINEQINRLARNKPEGIPFFATIVDPDSFTNTVENIFHTSFLIKEGRIGVTRERSKKKPMIYIEQNPNSSSPPERERSTTEHGCQSILSFSMADYKNWISTFNIRRRSFIPRVNGDDQ